MGRLAWPRLTVLAAAFLVLFATNSRTAMLALALASLSTAVLLACSGRLHIPRFAEPRMQLVAGAVLLHEAVTPRTLVALVAVCLGLVAVNLRPRRPQRALSRD